LRNPAPTCRIAFVVILSCVSVFASASWANDVSLPNAPTPSVMPANGHGAGFQGASVDSQTGTLARAPGPPTMVQRPGSSRHHFWDGENVALFSAVGASRALDYSSTLNMRRRGRQEILLTNNVVDNHPAFAAIEAGGTAVSVGASYLFHRYHHHRLEHWTSIVHASLTTSGAIRNYCLKTAHASTIP
jgi:hypothetical protein